jgi:peptide-methionine (S)-S-oxide reductase
MKDRKKAGLVLWLGAMMVLNPHPRAFSENQAVEKSYPRATFAGGCFWGLEKYLAEEPGVVSTRVGYTGGTVKNPGYERVCTGLTGHAEAVEAVYDPSKTSYRDLLGFFFRHHDPTTLNRQGPDIGTQYRSAIFYHSAEQEKEARQAVALLENAKIFPRPIVTEIKPAGEFYAAEDYHQKYLQKNPAGYCSIHTQSDRISRVLRTARR